MVLFPLTSRLSEENFLMLCKYGTGLSLQPEKVNCAAMLKLGTMMESYWRKHHSLMLQQAEVNDSLIETNDVHKTPMSSPWLQKPGDSDKDVMDELYKTYEAIQTLDKIISMLQMEIVATRSGNEMKKSNESSVSSQQGPQRRKLS